MFKKFFKKEKPMITAPATGLVMSIQDVADPVFSSKAMGDGFGVEPTSGDIFAPITGKVTSVFPTKHAIGLLDEQGNEVRVHMGIDTVSLQGTGFDLQVKEGDAVTNETLLAKMDLAAIKASGKATTVIVVFTNGQEKELTLKTGDKQAKEAIAQLK